MVRLFAGALFLIFCFPAAAQQQRLIPYSVAVPNGLAATIDTFNTPVGPPWQTLPGQLIVSGNGSLFYTFGTPNATIDTTFNCVTPNYVPNQPPGLGVAAINLCATYSTNTTGTIKYTNTIQAASFVDGPQLSINTIQGTVVARQDGTGGAGLQGTGKSHAPQGVAHGIELEANCHSTGTNCDQARSAMFLAGGGNGGGAIWTYQSWRSGAAVNSPRYGIILGDGVSINPFNTGPGSAIIAAAPGGHVRADYGFDLQNFSCITALIRANGFTVDCAGNVTAASINGGGGGISAKSIFAGNTNSVINPNQTIYFSMAGFSGGIVQAEIIAPFAFTATNLNAKGHAPAGAGQSYTYVLMKNGVATSLTCTMTGSSQAACSDNANSVSFAAGDRYQFRLVTSTAAAVVVHSASFAVNP